MESSMKPGLEYLVGRGDDERHVRVRRLGKTSSGSIRYGVTIDEGPELEIDAVRPVEDVLSLVHQTRSWEAGLVETEDGFEVEVMGVQHELDVIDPRRKALRMSEVAGTNAVKTQMPGRVVRILVAEGDEVVEGQPVIVLEAMKMENELKSPCTGTVARVCVNDGDQVQARSTLIEFA
jgi:biotin carboxyl carrier protein